MSADSRSGRAVAPRRGRPAVENLVAVIDIGTNSTKLLVGRVRRGRVETVLFARETTRIGAGLGRAGGIGPAAVVRTIRAVRRLAAAARRAGARHVFAVGTHAFRAAGNGRRVARRIARETGVPVRILSGREEAMLSYQSARSRVARPRPHSFVIDVGGGSTEMVVASRGRVVLVRSLPLGALRLTERHLSSDPIAPAEYASLNGEIAATVARAVARLGRLPPASLDLVASGGSATTALDMATATRRRGASRARVLTLADARRLERACLEAPLSRRKRLPGLPPDRADIMPAGLAVVLAFMTKLGKRSILIHGGGVREGLILTHAK